jgi:hypothetical protein
MISEYWIWMNLEGSSHVIIWGALLVFSKWTEENYNKPRSEQYSALVKIQTEHKSEAPLHKLLPWPYASENPLLNKQRIIIIIIHV